MAKRTSKRKSLIDTIAATPTVKIVSVTPDQAAAWLEGSSKNRNISDVRVRAYAEEMKRGHWEVTNQGIGFRRGDGKLIDGQHRLWAVIEAGVTVDMQITIGLHPDAVIDGGRPRRLGDNLTMRGEQYGSYRAAYVIHCAKLLVGSGVLINTVSAYDAWMRFLKPGVEHALEALMCDSLLKAAPIGGSLALAYRADPQKIMDFTLRLRDGEGLRKGEPAWTLRRYLEQDRLAGKRNGRKRGDTPLVIARKVLRAAQMHVTGAKSTTRLYADVHTGVDYFTKAYDTRALKRLVEPWRHTTQATKDARAKAGAQKLKRASAASKS